MALPFLKFLSIFNFVGISKNTLYHFSVRVFHGNEIGSVTSGDHKEGMGSAIPIKMPGCETSKRVFVFSGESCAKREQNDSNPKMPLYVHIAETKVNVFLQTISKMRVLSFLPRVIMRELYSAVLSKTNEGS